VSADANTLAERAPELIGAIPEPRLESMADAGTGYPRPPIVLIVTGHEWLSLSIESVFAARGYAVLRAFTGLQAARQLAVSVDLLIVDRDLRDTTGVALCRSLLHQGLVGAATPMILISADPWDREEKLEALRAGLWDAASLPWDAEELFLRMDAWVRGKLAADTARDQGLVDTTTGLYNAQGVLRRITELAAAAARHRRPLGVVVLTRNGRPQGVEGPLAATAADRLFAELLKGLRRASDAIGRLNAAQFVVLARGRRRGDRAAGGGAALMPAIVQRPASSTSATSVPDFGKRRCRSAQRLRRSRHYNPLLQPFGAEKRRGAACAAALNQSQHHRAGSGRLGRGERGQQLLVLLLLRLSGCDRSRASRSGGRVLDRR
jgi:CheY-like chemotaxis protein